MLWNYFFSTQKLEEEPTISLTNELKHDTIDDVINSQSEQSFHESDQSEELNDNTIVQDEEDDLPPVTFEIPSIPKLTQVWKAYF